MSERPAPCRSTRDNSADFAFTTGGNSTYESRARIQHEQINDQLGQWIVMWNAKLTCESDGVRKEHHNREYDDLRSEVSFACGVSADTEGQGLPHCQCGKLAAPDRQTVTVCVDPPIQSGFEQVLIKSDKERQIPA